VALNIAVQNAKTVFVHANTLIAATPSPAFATVQLVVEVISLPAMPEASNNNPSCPSPALQDSVAVKVTAYTAPLAPAPLVWSVVMVFLPHLPESTNDAPLALVVAPDYAQTILVHANAPETAPGLAHTTMETVVEVILAQAMPVTTDLHPTYARPAFESSQAVQMTADATVASPEPTWSPVEVVALPHLPELADNTPTSLTIAPNDAQAISVNSDASEAAPSLANTTMEMVVEVISAVALPVLANRHPADTGPAPQDVMTVPVASDSLGSPPEPTRGLVVMVLLPHLPELADDAPLALDVAPDDAQAVLVDTNAPEASPGLTDTTMEAVVELILAPKVPIAANLHPAGTCPALVSSEAVQVTPDTAITSPEPTWGPVVVIFLPHLPELPDNSPLALVISPDNTQAIPVYANTSEGTPSLTHATVVVVIEMVASVAMPELAHNHPFDACPSLQDAQAIQMPSNSPGSANKPTPCSIIVVLLPQVPIGTDTTPFALIVAEQDSQPVPVHTNSPKTTPAPLLPSMELMVVIIAFDDLPIPTDHDPTGTSPTVLDAHTVAMPCNSSVRAPSPAIRSVEVITLPEMPVRPDTSPVALIIALQCATPIQVQTNAPQLAQDPSSAAVQRVLVIIPLSKRPILADQDPSSTIPTLENSQAIEMSVYTSICTPEPTGWLVEMFLPPHVPIGADTAPVAVVIAL